MTPPDPTALLLRVTELEAELAAQKAEALAADRIFDRLNARFHAALAMVADLKEQRAQEILANSIGA